MYISHSVMKGQRHNNPLNPCCFCLQRPKRDGTSSSHIIVEVAKALGGSFKLVTLAKDGGRNLTGITRGKQFLFYSDSPNYLDTWISSSVYIQYMTSFT